MTIDSARFQKLLNEFKLEQLFNELGWDHASLRQQDIPVNGGHFTLTTVAQKRGVAVFLCAPDASGNIPARPVLLKIEKEATKLAHEHLLIFTDTRQSMLTWLWVSRAPGQPTATRTHTWHKGTSGESLRQKLNQIVWSLEQEEAITLTDVITGLRRAFDRDRVSRTFYEKFKAEHEAFADFIEGLQGVTDKAWYASLMLNRLMFVYFIQHKGFLDSNINYLADRMKRVRNEAGEGHFHSFYRHFLRRLFHEGLGLPKGSRGSELANLIGDVPYLNGGLFAEHELEEANPDIDIPDTAFERLFQFFDAHDWHLDDRPLTTGNEINPDVLGYIFEKYINQKQMGAYYTKEDITEYISKNTVIPHLLEEAKERCKVAFEGDASIWNMLKDAPDRYIYPAMKTGVIDVAGQVIPESALPDFVQSGMKDAKTRMFERRYNLNEAVFHTSPNERGTLPTETWREYVERRARCLSLHSDLINGQVKNTDDLITLNLDIRQFMQDVIDNSNGPDLLRAVWQAIVGRVPENVNETFRHGITILDPTCGSGAFLFAALNVLEPLYEACLDRMEGFVEDAKKLGKVADLNFTKILEEVAHHPSRRYFIYKSIILHNLFGVDIMAEAVEICKLRLFLKLVSQVDGNRELEPLPDIDFNIRTGNTLVGYTTESKFDAIGSGNMEYGEQQDHKTEIKANVADLAGLFDVFRTQQTVHGGNVTADNKRKLREKLNGLSLELDRYLARDYGIDPRNTQGFSAWRESHQPFHWFAEFYGVMREGGFDVVIGNPPYVEYKDVSSTYSTMGLETQSCGNLFAYTTERSKSIAKNTGLMGMIIPLSAFSTDRMTPLIDNLKKSSASLHISHFGWRPAKLFDGVNLQLSIVIQKYGPSLVSIKTSKYNLWESISRQFLFEKLEYAFTIDSRLAGSIPKLGTKTAVSILHQLRTKHSEISRSFTKKSQNNVFYRRGGLYWKVFVDFETYSSEEKTISLMSDVNRYHIVSALSSSLWWWYFTITSDCRHLGNRDISSFPFDPRILNETDSKTLSELGIKYINDLRLKSKSETRVYKGKKAVECTSFRVKQSKSIIDEIDLLICKSSGLSDEETDFIINYDIKYRIGGGDEDE